jgi:predicted RNase H-like nuclease (RuvC/YqgF family)
MIGDLAKALAEETTECEQLERELAEVRKQRDILERALMIIESLYVDGKDTHEDWETIGQIAKQALLRITPTEKNEQTNY